MDKGVGMMMRNKTEDLTPLYPFLITFHIYEIKERLIARFDDTSDEEADLGEFAHSYGRQRGERQW